MARSAPVGGAAVNARLRTLLLEHAAVVSATNEAQPLAALGEPASGTRVHARTR